MRRLLQRKKSWPLPEQGPSFFVSARRAGEGLSFFQRSFKKIWQNLAIQGGKVGNIEIFCKKVVLCAKKHLPRAWELVRKGSSNR
jgi:hypothetical protein